MDHDMDHTWIMTWIMTWIIHGIFHLVVVFCALYHGHPESHPRRVRPGWSRRHVNAGRCLVKTMGTRNGTPLVGPDDLMAMDGGSSTAEKCVEFIWIPHYHNDVLDHLGYCRSPHVSPRLQVAASITVYICVYFTPDCPKRALHAFPANFGCFSWAR